MPRTITAESPGCPRLRALTSDVLGLIKVIEARGGEQKDAPTVVERWGDPVSSRCVLATSMIDREHDPLLGVARKDGTIEVLSTINGDVRLAIPTSSGSGGVSNDDAIVAMHLFSKQRVEPSSMSSTLLTCTTKGQASIRSFEIPKSLGDSITESSSQTTWNVCGSGNILCSKVDSSENYALFGGKGVEINVWDLEQSGKIWAAKSPPKNSLGIFTPTWFTSATFLSKDDHRKIIAGTNSHQVRLYDISAQRRPVISFDFREAPIKAVAEDLDGWTVYVGTGSGDLASFDMRTGKLLGSFLGKCSGSIRSIARHRELPVIGSCGLDSYLRIWDVKSRKLLSGVFLKQHLTSVVFDSHFSNEAPKTPEPQDLNGSQEECEEEATMPTKRKKASKDHSRKKKLKTKKSAHQDPEQQGVSEMSHSEDHENGLNDEAEEEMTLPRKEKASKRHTGKKKKTAYQDPEQQDASEMSHSEDHENRLNDEAEEEGMTLPRKEKASIGHSGKKKKTSKRKGESSGEL